VDYADIPSWTMGGKFNSLLDDGREVQPLLCEAAAVSNTGSLHSYSSSFSLEASLFPGSPSALINH